MLLLLLTSTVPDEDPIDPGTTAHNPTDSPVQSPSQAPTSIPPILLGGQ